MARWNTSGSGAENFGRWGGAEEHLGGRDTKGKHLGRWGRAGRRGVAEHFRRRGSKAEHLGGRTGHLRGQQGKAEPQDGGGASCKLGSPPIISCIFWIMRG